MTSPTLSAHAGRLFAVLPPDGSPITLRKAGHLACLSGMHLYPAALDLRGHGLIVTDPPAGLDHRGGRPVVLRRPPAMQKETAA